MIDEWVGQELRGGEKRKKIASFSEIAKNQHDDDFHRFIRWSCWDQLFPIYLRSHPIQILLHFIAIFKIFPIFFSRKHFFRNRLHAYKTL